MGELTVLFFVSFFNYFYLFFLTRVGTIPRRLDPRLECGPTRSPRLYSYISDFALSRFSFDVVQSAVMDNYLSLYHVAPPPDHSLRFYSKKSLEPGSLAPSKVHPSWTDASVEGYHRILYHISYYNTACYNPCCRVLYRFCAFFPFFGKAATDDDRHVCDRFLSREIKG